VGAVVGVYLCAQGSYGMCVCKWVQVWVCSCVHRALMICAFVSGCGCGCVSVCTGLLWFVRL